MDGASLAFATVTVFKEIYLVSKFVYKKISTVNNHITEKEVLIKNFYWEFLYLRSFHAVLLQSDNRIVIDQGLNEVGIFVTLITRRALTFTLGTTPGTSEHS